MTSMRIIQKGDYTHKVTMGGNDELTILARDIVLKIESELDYPGQIKVNVIRENRAVDYAK